jgi:hypothetical protein
MHYGQRFLFCSLVSVMLVGLSQAQTAAQQADRTFVVSFPLVKLAEPERIVGFRCSVTPGRILSLREFPDEWEVTVENGDSETATIRGQVLVGAGAFSARWNNSFFQKFMTVKLQKPSPSGPPLHITAELQITTDDTFEHYRYERFDRGNVKLEEVPKVVVPDK